MPTIRTVADPASVMFPSESTSTSSRALPNVSSSGSPRCRSPALATDALMNASD